MEWEELLSRPLGNKSLMDLEGGSQAPEDRLDHRHALEGFSLQILIG
jgi:hypothetical protein